MSSALGPAAEQRRAQLDQAEIADRAVGIGAQARRRRSPRPTTAPGRARRTAGRPPPGPGRLAAAPGRASAPPARARPPAAARAPPARPGRAQAGDIGRPRRPAQVAGGVAHRRQQAPLDPHRLARGDELAAQRPDEGVGDRPQPRRTQPRPPPHRRARAAGRAPPCAGRACGRRRPRARSAARRAPRPGRARRSAPPDRRRAAATPEPGPGPAGVTSARSSTPPWKRRVGSERPAEVAREYGRRGRTTASTTLRLRKLRHGHGIVASDPAGSGGHRPQVCSITRWSPTSTPHRSIAPTGSSSATFAPMQTDARHGRMPRTSFSTRPSRSA